MSNHSRSLFLAILLTGVLLGGCAGTRTTSSGLDAASIAGTWAMDLSPKQDGSYIKELVIVPVPSPGTPERSFTGSVYGGSAFDNGLIAATADQLIFSFVSDEVGQQGGPYYWLGSQGPIGQLTGRVQSLTRSFQSEWSALRAASPATGGR